MGSQRGVIHRQAFLAYWLWKRYNDDGSDDKTARTLQVPAQARLCTNTIQCSEEQMTRRKSLDIKGSGVLTVGIWALAPANCGLAEPRSSEVSSPAA